MKKSVYVSLAITLFLSLMVGPISAAPVVYMEPESLIVDLGTDFQIDLYISFSENDGIGGLYSAGAEMRFCPENMSYKSYSIDTAIWNDPARTVIETGADYVKIASSVQSNSRDMYGEIKIAEISFTALNIGTCFITLADPNLAPVGDFFDWDSDDPFDGAVQFKGGTVNVVPIPGAILLLGSGLLGLIGIGRKRMRKS